MRVRAVHLLVVAGLALTGTSACGTSAGSDAGTTSEARHSLPTLDAGFTFEVETARTTTTSCPPSAVRFTDTSEGDPTAWEWEFPGGRTSTEQNPTVEAPISMGEVTLTVTRGDESDTYTEQLVFPIC